MVEEGGQSASHNQNVTQIQARTVLLTLLLGNKDTDEEVLKALNDYLDNILTDKNKIPLEIILAETDLVKELDYYHIPLPEIFTELDVTFRDAAKSANTGELGRMHAVAAIAQNPHIVVIGNPGAGKTTLINYLSVLMALVFMGDATHYGNPLNKDGAKELPEVLFPVNIQIRAFASSEEFKKGGRDALINYIIREVIGLNTHLEREIRPHILDMLKKGKMLIVLDGLDHLPGEVRAEGDHQSKPAEHRQKLKDILIKFAEHPGYGQNRIVVTSRSYAYHQEDKWSLGKNFSVAELMPFTNEQIGQYILYWLRQLEEFKTGRSEKYRPLSQAKLEERAVEYLDEITRNKHFLSLARTPLILTFIVSQFGADFQGGKRLHMSRAELYENVIKMLVKRWSRYSEEGNREDGPWLHEQLKLPTHKTLEKLLSITAFEAQKRMDDDEESSITKETLKWAWGVISQEYQIETFPNEDVWEKLETRTGILMPARTEEIKGKHQEIFEFPHLSLQEALAARAIAARTKQYIDLNYIDQKYVRDPLRIEDLVLGLLETRWERWRNVISLLLEGLIDTAPDDFQRVVKAILENTSENPIPVTDPTSYRWYAALFLAGFCYDGFADPVRYKAFGELSNWLELSIKTRAMNLEERFEAGVYLGVIQGKNDALNDPSSEQFWRRIRKSQVFLGTPAYSSKKPLREERPQRYIKPQTGFLVSKFPVTNGLFSEFVSNGYQTEKFWKWCGASLDWYRAHKKDLPVLDERMPNAPCVNICWYEAAAFCLWLSDHYKGRWVFTLPTEEQWLAAAQAGNDTLYVGTDNFDTADASRYSTKISPVGLFEPNGAGVYDLCNGVREWTSTLFVSTFENDGRNLKSINQRTMKKLGRPDVELCVKGTGVSDQDPRIGRRGGVDPTVRSPIIGFRLVAKARRSG